MTTFSQINQNSQAIAKSLAYEYIVLKMCRWYAQENGLNSIVEFNKANDLTMTKLLLYPFFTCIANGSFDTLYDYFSPFYALEDGPVSKVALEEIVPESKMRFFTVSSDFYTVGIKTEGIEDEIDHWGYIENRINQWPLIVSTGGQVTFCELVFANSDKVITSAIDSSVAAIKKQTGSLFICYDEYQLTTLARQHKSWSTIFNYYSSLPDTKLEDFEILKDEANKDRKIFKPIEELDKEIHAN